MMQDNGFKNILEQLDKHKEKHFIILVGEKGSGKKTTVKSYCSLNNIQYVVVGNKINNIREIKELAYNYQGNMLLCIEDGDSLNIQAQNALLKLCEEPPTNTSIVICVESENSLLPTILSRGTVIYMPLCAKTDLQLYAKQKLNLLHNGFKMDLNTLTSICTTYGYINTFIEQDVDALLAFCEKVLSNYDKVNIVNAFKIAHSLKLKESGIGFDLECFLLTIIHVIMKQDVNPKTLVELRITKNALKLLKENVPKQQVFDVWLLWLRRGY